MSIDVSFEPETMNDKMGGVRSGVSWNRLKPWIAHEINLKPNQKINGLRVDENGITVRIGYD